MSAKGGKCRWGTLSQGWEVLYQKKIQFYRREEAKKVRRRTRFPTASGKMPYIVRSGTHMPFWVEEPESQSCYAVIHIRCTATLFQKWIYSWKNNLFLFICPSLRWQTGKIHFWRLREEVQVQLCCHPFCHLNAACSGQAVVWSRQSTNKILKTDQARKRERRRKGKY